MIDRKGFLRLGTIALASFFPSRTRLRLPDAEELAPLAYGRVAIAYLRLYSEASYRSAPVGWLLQDQLVEIHAEVSSPSGPPKNPRWYRLTGGYAHSAHIQRLDGVRLNQAARHIPDGGQLGEITVPFSQSLRPQGTSHWEKLYRLYFGSVHWITDMVSGPDQESWYQITDERLHVRFIVPAAHVRLISPAEILPIATHVPPEEKRIEISLREQRLTAFEADQPVFSTLVSTGIPSDGPTDNGIPTETPAGKFYISTKMPSRHMGDGEITSDPQAYELVGVPWACFFVSTGVALHGTYWHDNFGQRMSHGCVNMRNSDALWVYRWTNPIIQPGEWYARGRGTLVIIS
ncbi:MAG: L,D-transpeptidase [Anaerolineales bacterium]